MTNTAILAGLMLLISTGCAAAMPGYGGTISDHPDRFDGTSSVHLRRAVYDHPRGGSLTFDAYSDDDGVLLSFSPDVRTIFQTRRGWEYLSCHSVDVLRDGGSVDHEAPDHDGAVGDPTGPREYVKVRMSRTQFRTLAAAESSIEFRVCNDEFRASAEQMAQLRRFYNRAFAGRADL